MSTTYFNILKGDTGHIDIDNSALVLGAIAARVDNVRDSGANLKLKQYCLEQLANAKKYIYGIDGDAKNPGLKKSRDELQTSTDKDELLKRLAGYEGRSLQSLLNALKAVHQLEKLTSSEVPNDNLVNNFINAEPKS